MRIRRDVPAHDREDIVGICRARECVRIEVRHDDELRVHIGHDLIEADLIELHDSRIGTGMAARVSIGNERRGDAGADIAARAVRHEHPSVIEEDIGDKVRGRRLAIRTGHEHEMLRHRNMCKEVWIHLLGNDAGKLSSHMSGLPEHAAHKLRGCQRAAESDGGTHA